MSDTGGTYALQPRARFRKVGEDGVVIAMDRDEVVVVNELGAFILSQLQSPTALERIADAVCAEFSVAPSVATDDCRDYLESLIDRGIVQQA